MNKYSYKRLLCCVVLLSLFAAATIFPVYAKETDSQYNSIIENIQLEKLENEPKKQVRR